MARLQDVVPVVHAWHGMCCNNCARGIVDRDEPAAGNPRLPHVTGCDLCLAARDHGYCKVYVPHEDRISKKRDIVGMVQAHVQRWIIEPLGVIG